MTDGTTDDTTDDMTETMTNKTDKTESTNSGVPLSLAGRTALITGGSRGIGAATVRLFRQAGARVAFSYQSAIGQAQALSAECGGPSLCLPIQQSLDTVEDGQALIAQAIAGLGKLDCLVVNHGIWPSQDVPIATMSNAQWRTTLSVNLDSVFGLVQAAVAQMETQRHDSSTPRGHIVLVASTAAQRGEAFHADYAASKGALISLTKSLSSELAPIGIHCNCVAPGWVATEMSAAALSHPETSRKAMSLIPLGRPAHVDEIAGPILFLCTPLAGFISGEIFNVNGGAVLVG
jgi:3-oxoacyl-[acyl-carrier protein] reductase